MFISRPKYFEPSDGENWNLDKLGFVFVLALIHPSTWMFLTPENAEVRQTPNRLTEQQGGAFDGSSCAANFFIVWNGGWNFKCMHDTAESSSMLVWMLILLVLINACTLDCSRASSTKIMPLRLHCLLYLPATEELDTDALGGSKCSPQLLRDFSKLIFSKLVLKQISSKTQKQILLEYLAHYYVCCFCASIFFWTQRLIMTWAE